MLSVNLEDFQPLFFQIIFYSYIFLLFFFFFLGTFQTNYCSILGTGSTCMTYQHYWLVCCLVATSQIILLKAFDVDSQEGTTLKMPMVSLGRQGISRAVIYCSPDHTQIFNFTTCSQTMLPFSKIPWGINSFIN